MKFKGTKCIEITKSEYDDIKFIEKLSSCQADVVDKVIDYLIKGNKVNQTLPRYVLKDIAYNVYMAIDNDYKYMKVVD